MVLLSENHNIASTMWSSPKLKRANALADKTLALSDGCDAFYFIASLAKEMIFPKQHKDCKYWSIYWQPLTIWNSEHNKIDPRKTSLSRISVLREMCEKKQLFINWIEKQCQLSDVLAKRRAPHRSLIEPLQKMVNYSRSKEKQFALILLLYIVIMKGTSYLIMNSLSLLLPLPLSLSLSLSLSQKKKGRQKQMET